MKVTYFILIILGWILVIANFLAYLGKAAHVEQDTETVNKVAFYIGYNLFFATGLILLIIGYRLRRKVINKKKNKHLMDNFLSNKPDNFE